MKVSELIAQLERELSPDDVVRVVYFDRECCFPTATPEEWAEAVAIVEDNESDGMASLHSELEEALTEVSA